MKQRLLLSVATGVLVAASWAVSAVACEDKATTADAAAAKAKVCTAEMAAKCTPAQAAACKAKGASAVTASASGGCSHDAAAMTASGACPHGASASAKASRNRKYDAAVAGGYSCGGRGMSTMADHFSHGDCDACSGMSSCDGELKATGAVTQIVKLKNGIMYVYTAPEPGKVRAVQAAIAQRNDRLTAITAAGDKAKLCRDCRVMRGAMASGKLTREMVTIEGGCLTLMTSSDPAIVAKLHGLVGQQTASRVKI
jgi:hypothetical protein